MTDHGFETLVEMIGHWAKETPDATAYRFLWDLGDSVSDVTYAQMDRESRARAVSLLARAAPGDRAVLVFSREESFVKAFFGCVYAGIVPVPAPPPIPGRSLVRFFTLFADCEPSLVLADSRILAQARGMEGSARWLSRVPWIDADAELRGVHEDWEAPPTTGASTAYLQYTSGSTTAPKGVIIGHGALLEDSAAVGRCFGFEGRTVRMVAWLPLYHDMGLIGHVINPAYFGAMSILMPTFDFLQRPFSWLKAISDHEATFSVAPNFAFDLCVARVSKEQKGELDLSAWNWAANGSEPVRVATMERFAAAFAGCGFEPGMFFPCYGLAEGLFISTGPKGGPPISCRASRAHFEENRIVEVGEEAEGAVVFASCGPVRDDCEVRIVDPISLEVLGENEVGEIWMTGAGVTDGYWNKPEETEEIFRARPSGSDEPHLRTGDLGFLKDGNLYICGRTKDLIIINGKNFHPQDLELTVSGAHPALRPGSCAAFSVEEGDRERLVVVCEIRNSVIAGLDGDEVVGAIREVVSREHGVALHDGVLIEPGSLPKTTSGKIMRSACRRMYLAGELDGLKGNEDER